MDAREHSKKEQGFTLIELLIAIVVVGILAAVAIVGIGGLTSTAGKSSCKASADAATSASAAYYANQTPNAWPASFSALVTASATNTPPVYTLQSGVTNPTANTLKGNGWTLTGAFSAGAAPDFTSAGNGCTTP